MSNAIELVQDEAEFFRVYPKAKENWEKANISWDDLKGIRADYLARVPSLQTTANAFSAHLQTLPNVHSTRVRVKHADHVIEKIVRKRATDRDVNSGNYHLELTDLIGARALHLFKTDWLDIHQSILQTWDENEKPIAYIREGDDATFYEENGVAHEIHKAGYRSVHYGVKTNFTKETHVVELQVRTIFEEAWGEIDHKIRYPYFVGDKLLEAFSSQLNRIAGSADEMALVILVQQAATAEWREKQQQLEEENQAKEQELNQVKSQLKDAIEKSKATEDEKSELLKKLESLSSSVVPTRGSSGIASPAGTGLNFGVGFGYGRERQDLSPALKAIQDAQELMGGRGFKQTLEAIQRFQQQNRGRY